MSPVVRSPIGGDTPKQNAAPPAQPRMVPGIARRTLAVTASDLAALYPEHTLSSLHAAALELSAVSLHDFGWRQVQAIGAAAHGTFGQLADRLLAVSRDDAQRTALQHVGRLVELLNGMLPTYASAGGLWSRRMGPTAIARCMREVDQLRANLRELLPHLDTLFGELDRAEQSLRKAHDELVGAALACEYLDRPESNLPTDTGGQLPDRALELSRASAAALQTRQLLHSQQRTLSVLRQQIRETVMTAVPAWMANWSAAPAEPNETERFSLHQSLSRLIESLKS